jgi:dihydrofolate reductase
MGKTIVYIGVSLDGFIATRDDKVDWLYRYNDVDYGYDDFVKQVGLVVMGRRAYELNIKRGWGWPYPVSGFVLSEEPSEVPEGADITFVKGDVHQILKQAKARTDKDIWIEGGAHVVQSFIKEGLVDEVTLAIVPTILGGGISLFGELGKQVELERLSVQTYDEGLTLATYRVQK